MKGSRTKSPPPRGSPSSRGSWMGKVGVNEEAKSLQTLKLGKVIERLGATLGRKRL